MESKKKKEPIEAENELVVTICRRWGVGNWGEGGQNVQTFNYKINKFWECNVQHVDCS